jgi:hypothetical protein
VCCFFLLLFFFGPRAVLVLEWIFGHKIQVVFDHWYWPLLGLIFLPWTTLMYVIVWHDGGVHGANWIAVGIGVVLDVITYASRASQKAYMQRRTV